MILLRADTLIQFLVCSLEHIRFITTQSTSQVAVRNKTLMERAPYISPNFHLTAWNRSTSLIPRRTPVSRAVRSRQAERTHILVYAKEFPL